MKYLVYILIVLFALTGCEKMFLPDNTYLIKEGKHRSTSNISIINGTNISFSFTFEEEHQYLDEINTTQINKLYGLTSTSIHKNSARIGWRQEDEEFVCFAYWYLDGDGFNSYELYRAQLGERVDFTIRTGDTYVFIANDVTFITPGHKCKFLAYPYFGGTIPAPHKMYFEINT